MDGCNRPTPRANDRCGDRRCATSQKPRVVIEAMETLLPQDEPEVAALVLESITPDYELIFVVDPGRDRTEERAPTVLDVRCSEGS